MLYELLGILPCDPAPCNILLVVRIENLIKPLSHKRVEARSLLCYWAVRELGVTMAELSRRLNISLSGVSISVKRGETIVRDNGYKLIDL
jgi:hypothetical protein